jgi:transcriptional regulator with XRE-family HTH domain
MTDDMDGLGPRLRQERERVPISQRELARRLGLSSSLISQIESGQSKPSVGTLYSIVSELGISLDRLFGHDQERHQAGAHPCAPVVHGQERDAIELASGVRWERLTADQGDGVDFLFVVYDVGGASAAEDALMRHQGKEYGYVISGRLGIQVGFEQHRLGPGDSIAFESTHPHRLWNTGDEPVHGIWVVVGRNG